MESSPGAGLCVGLGGGGGQWVGSKCSDSGFRRWLVFETCHSLRPAIVVNDVGEYLHAKLGR